MSSPPDLKGAVKAVQAALASSQPAEALRIATPLLSAGVLEAQTTKEPKQRAQAYTLLAFAGLAHAQSQQLAQAEACYLRATALQEDQFPAWKGLYDVYTQQVQLANVDSKDAAAKVRSVLEKLVPLAPAGLKKLSYASHLLRLQLEQPAIASTPAPADLSASVDALLADPALSVPADSKDPAKDAAEVARLTLDLRFSALLAHEAQERAAKHAELRVRLDRQLSKYRDEREKTEKLRAQQAASKAVGAMAAVQSVKGPAAPVLSQAEEEADIVRRVTLKLENEYAAKLPATEELEKAVLATPAAPVVASAQPGQLEPLHRRVHERILARMILQAHMSGAFSASPPTPDAFAQAVKQIEAKAAEIVANSGSALSPYAVRVLISLRWTIGGAGGSDVAARDALREHQCFLERALAVLCSPAEAGDDAAWLWMAWHSLASSIVSLEEKSAQMDKLLASAPAALQSAIKALGDNASVFEIAEAILKNVSEPEASTPAAAVASSSSSSAASSAAALGSSVLIAGPSPLAPTFLSPVTLSYALLKQGESRHKDCMASIAPALAAIKAFRAACPSEKRLQRASNHVELTLAAAYATRTLDERSIDSAARIFSRLKGTLAAEVAAGGAAADREGLSRALQGLVSCALLAKPRPNYPAAEEHLRELVNLEPENEYAQGMRGFLALQEARAMRTGSSSSAASSDARLARLREAATCLLKALELSPSSATHQLRLGHAYMEQDIPGADEPRTDASFAKAAFEKAADLAAKAESSAAKGSAAAAVAKRLWAEAVAMQGVWSADVAHDAEAARKSFVAALKLDPSNDVAGPRLCEHLLAGGGAAAQAPGGATDASSASTLKRLHAVHALALQAVRASPRCVWGWVRLARSQVALKDVPGAVVSYQNALRIEGGDHQAVRMWQELADCYNAEGQFVAAYKAIARCVNLSASLLEAEGGAGEKDPSAPPTPAAKAHELNLYLLAKCQLNLGGISEAIRTLESTASLREGASQHVASATFVPAVHLLAQALYVQANMNVHEGAYDSARMNLDRAVATVRRCIPSSSQQQQPKQFVSVLKLLGDCYALYNSLPVDDSASAAAGASSSDPELESAAIPEARAAADLPLCEHRKLAYLSLATRAYLQASELAPDVSEHLYDAALCQWKSALALHAPTPASSEGAQSGGGIPLHPLEASFRARGRDLVQKALLIAPGNSIYWQLLGVLDSRLPVRQHAFIRSLDPDSKDASAASGWTNLGMMYLQRSHDLASAAGAGTDERQALLGVSRHALEVAQTLDPSNPTLWSAQGLFNTSVGTLEAFVQARACFQRSLELYPPSAVARFGQAYTAYCTGDLSVARFAIAKFTEQYPRHASAWNLAGLILEQVASEGQDSLSSAGTKHTQIAVQAVEAFGRAEQLLAIDTQVASEAQRADLLRSVRINRARALASAGMLDDSAQLYQALIHHAAAQASSGAAPTAAVLAAAVTLHVNLALVYARQGALEQACAMQGTAVAISAQQLALVSDQPPASGDDDAAHQWRANRSALVLRRRQLLLQCAQFHAQSRSWDAAKQLLNQSVSESPETPHPHHYFHVMCALYAIALQQGDSASASYAVDLLSQCVAGLMGVAEGNEELMNQFLPTFYRIQAQVAARQGNFAQVRRMYAKILALNPTSLANWNEFYRSILSEVGKGQLDPAAASGRTNVGTILATASLPSLDMVHSCRLGESHYFARLELVALAFLALGRVGAPGSGGAAAASDEQDAGSSAAEADKAAAAALFKASDADEDAEFVDEAADEDVRAPSSKVAIVPLPPLGSSADETHPRKDNLTSGRLAAHLLHMDPTRTSTWGIQAFSLYAQALQCAASSPNDSSSSSSSASAAGALFSKAIKLLQLYTSLLTAELNDPALARSNPLEGGPRHAALMADLVQCQVLLVDALVRRAAGDDVLQAAALLQSIVEQQAAMGSAFPVHGSLLRVLAARVALRQGDRPSALGHYRAAIESQPLAGEIWEELSEVYANDGASQAAEACLSSALGLLEAARNQGQLSPALARSATQRLLLRLSLHAYAARSFAAGSEYAARALRVAEEGEKESGSSCSGAVVAAFLQGVNQAALNHPDQASRALQHALNLAHERAAGGSGGNASELVGPGAGGALLAAAGDAPLGLLKFNLALLFVRTAQAAGAPSGPLAEAQALLREELASGLVSSSAAAPILYQLALVSQKTKDVAAAQGYVRSALQLRPKNALYLRLQRELDGGAAEVPASWDA